MGLFNKERRLSDKAAQANQTEAKKKATRAAPDFYGAAAETVKWFVFLFTATMLGMVIAPIFKPLGFGDWRVSTALISGFTAKESVVSTLAVLTGSNISSLGEVLGSLFTPAAAVSFLAFTLLYTPCVAAIAAARRELGSKRAAFMLIVFQCCVAWLASFAVYNIAGLFV